MSINGVEIQKDDGKVLTIYKERKEDTLTVAIGQAEDGENITFSVWLELDKEDVQMIFDFVKAWLE